jgi:hypothetical protein
MRKRLARSGRSPGRVQGQEAGVESRHVFLHDLGRVALRIDADEQALQAFAVGTQQALGLGHLGHGRRADVRALGEAEEDHHRLARKSASVRA